MIPPEFAHQPTWILPRQPRGDTDADQIYAAVGKALSRWEELEIALGEMFAALVESRSAAAARAYGTLASAQGRLDLIDAAAEIYFGDRAGFETHRQLLKVLRLASPCRNNIAHGIIRQYATEEWEGGGSYLVSPEYNTRKSAAFIDMSRDTLDPFYFSRHKYAYTSSQVNELERRFNILARFVGNRTRNLPNMT